MIPPKIQEQLLQDALRHASLTATTSSKPMLGGAGVSAKGVLFALLLPNGTALRLSPEDQEHFLRIPGAARHVFPADPARAAAWIVAPPDMPDQTTHWATWVRKAFQFNERAVPGARRPPPKPGRKPSHGRSSRSR